MCNVCILPFYKIYKISRSVINVISILLNKQLIVFHASVIISLFEYRGSVVMLKSCIYELQKQCNDSRNVAQMSQVFLLG